ncbi:hypothetical protein AAGS61_12100 [Lysinibacillus sp. KU-BSD001]|uniref:hypothetical protein n=1 Tax=Lysinibacillus sp. KU-BSD001 TaxID=3141328 RepID=UPI0036E507AC
MKKLVNAFIAFLVIGSFILSVSFAKEENETALSSMHGVNGDFEVYTVDNTEILPKRHITESHIPVNNFTAIHTKQQVVIPTFLTLVHKTKMQEQLYKTNELMLHDSIYPFGHLAIHTSND